MKVFLHIGMPECGAARIQQVLDQKRDQLAGKSVLFPKAPGRRNHTRLYMAITDPDHVDPLRWNRGYGDPKAQAALLQQVMRDLDTEVNTTRPEVMILSADQLGASLHRPSELARLRGLLLRFCDDIRIVAHVDEPARLLARHYAEQVLSGRIAGLDQEIGLAQTPGAWRQASLAQWGEINAAINAMPEVQAPPFWLDYQALIADWEATFGAGTFRLRGYDPAVFNGPGIVDEVCAAFDLARGIGRVEGSVNAPPQPGAQWLTRCRQMNALFQTAQVTGRIIPRNLWRRMLGQLSLPGAPVHPGSLSAISALFGDANASLAETHGLGPAALAPDPALPDWEEPDPGYGFRASQYMGVFLSVIDKTTREEMARRKDTLAAVEPVGDGADLSGLDEKLSPVARKIMPPLARMNYAKLAGGRFAPHNDLGRVNEEELAAPYTPIEPRVLAPGNSGNVIVGCMKNEGPYIVEWVAYHRAIGFDNFLIHSNACEDGTSEILDRMQALGLIQHRNNDNWKGKSPQQYALNQSLKEDLIVNAEWITHIDVDEFINVRVGNGTISDFLERVPDATNVAMTWRLFGHNDVAALKDQPVIEQFDTCAPKYCPKPHTVWGFKTLLKNIGAYEKLSCHRPNKLRDGFRDSVQWVNGSGMPMGDDVKEKGWRSEVKSIGYDLIQLNHYALRSAESFLIKRQRGRALHVDRSIGLNYWVRMDWCDHKDVTIQRNVPRLHAEMQRMFQDDTLKRLHDEAVEWHRAKAEELRKMPEFEDLYTKALETRLNEMERVAYALALDMES